MVHFLQQLSPTKSLLKSFGFSIIMLALLMTSELHAQNGLEVPVKVDIENGNTDEVMIKLIKNGKTVLSQPSTNKVKLKLNFNCVYTIVISKPGYITKSVEFDTKAPKEHIADGFDPYKIGVKLFKQYDGVNITVYNQPVGKIKFDRDLDEFNYDTDYSKSILSNLQETEDKLAAIAKKEKETGEIVPVVQEKHYAPPTDPAADASPATASNDPKSITPAWQQDPASGKPGNGGSNAPTKTMGSGGEQTKDMTAMDGSNDISPSTVVSQGNDVGGSNHSNSGSNSGTPSLFSEDEKITREDIVEKNRIITIVRVTRGDVTTEYKRVNYHWGGPFFFKNDVANISQNVFAHDTGVKD